MEEELGLTLRPKIEIVAYLINQNIKKYINKKLTINFFNRNDIDVPSKVRDKRR